MSASDATAPASPPPEGRAMWSEDGTVPSGSPVIPSGMTEVSREAFWRHVMGEGRSIHPSPERHYSVWRLTGNGQPWGWTSHGYAARSEEHGGEPTRYALRDADSLRAAVPA